MIAPTPPSRIALLIAEMRAHLRLQGGLQHGTGDLVQQPTRPDQRHPLRPSLIDQLLGDPHIQARRVSGLPAGSRWLLSGGVLVDQQ